MTSFVSECEYARVVGVCVCVDEKKENEECLPCFLECLYLFPGH